MLLGWGIWGAFAVPTSRLETLVNFPNPFNPASTHTTIAYSLSQNATVNIRLLTFWRKGPHLGPVRRAARGPSGFEPDRVGRNRRDRRQVSAGGYVCQ